MTEDQHQPTSTNANRRDKGFTLIEVLIVTAILGTLSAVAVDGVGGITDKVRTLVCKAESQTLEVAPDSNEAANSFCPLSAGTSLPERPPRGAESSSG